MAHASAGGPLWLLHVAAAPAPVVGQGQVYAGSDNHLYFAPAAGAVVRLDAPPILLSQLAQDGATVGQYPQWSGTAWVPVTVPPAATPKTILLFGASSVAATTVTRYLWPGFDNATAPTAPMQFRIPFSGTARNLFVRQNGFNGNGLPVVYSLRLNGVATALAASVPSTSIDGSNLVSSVAVAAGDVVDLVVTKAASVGASVTDVVVTLEIDP